MRIRFRVLPLLVSLARVPGGADQMHQEAMARPTGGCDSMCVGMMEKEKALFPGVITAGAAFTVLSTAALALLVVLEVLWIRL